MNRKEKPVGGKMGAARPANWERQEERTADRLGGKRVSGSGNQPHKRGDIDLPTFKIECKSTKHKSISITAEMLNKIAKEAAPTGKLPALAVSIEGVGKGSPADADWVMIELRVFKKLLDGGEL